MSEEHLVIEERFGTTAVLSLNRPRVHNALNSAIRTELRVRLDEADADDTVRVVVLAGVGSSFCSGRDLKEAARGSSIYPTRSAELSSFNRRSIGKPIIAAVHGHVLGGGFELALACDLIVAARGARFALPEVHRNMVATGGGLLRLGRRLPPSLATEMALTGEPRVTDDLAEYGLFARVCELDDLRSVALELAELVSRGGPSAVRATKGVLRMAALWGDSDAAFDAQAGIAAWAHASPDREEGVRAFAEKRAPIWSDF